MSGNRDETAAPASETIDPGVLLPPSLVQVPGSHFEQQQYGPSLTAQEVLSGTTPTVTYKQVPLGPWDGLPPARNISFAVQGYAGPSVQDILSGIRIDGARDAVFSELGHRSIKYRIIWPGLDIPGHTLGTIKSGQHLLRGHLAAHLALELMDVRNLIITPPKRGRNRYPQEDPMWPLTQIDPGCIRLVGFNHYRSFWAPVWVVEYR